MSNMSYCRFQNTLSDLRDCEEALDEDAKLSESEEHAKQELLRLCERLVQDYL